MRLIVDTDPGNGIPGADIDDGFAIALALQSPEITLEAITVVAGNVPVERGVECALEILDAAGAADVPVHRGAERPLVADPSAWRAQLDARREERTAQRLWSDTRLAPSARPVHPTAAAQALVELVDAHPHEITVLAIGPLTNIATAMLIDPHWADKVERIVVMGGSFEVPNILQELNASYDPEAWHVVLSSTAPLLLVPLDVTLQTAMRMPDVDRLDEAGTPLASYLSSTARPWVTWHADHLERDGCPLHDPLALAAILDPEVITTRTANVAIELSGAVTRGRTVAWDAGSPGLLFAGLRVEGTRPVTIAQSVDNDRLVELLISRLAGHRSAGILHAAC